MVRSTVVASRRAHVFFQLQAGELDHAPVSVFLIRGLFNRVA